jgi:short subunit dehydrogenase-like uncharacterized protein
MAEREYDIVLFGATGFTGALTAEYLATNAPAGLRWAIAGRNAQKLADVRGKLEGADPGVLEADVTDEASVKALAEQTKVVITTVGPYLNYGEPLVAACASAGTDYVDLTGEPEFVDQMWLRYHEQARRNGARIVHSCGFDSIPYDLGALFTIQHLPEDVPIKLDCFVRASGTLSGGTYQTAITAFGRLRQMATAARERRRRESSPSGRKVKGSLGVPHHDEVAGGWVVPFPSIDPQTVLRSARALDRYGPDFTYSHYLVVGSPAMAAGLIAGAGTLIGLSQLPPARVALMKLKGPGEGPTPEERAKNWFRVRFAGRADGRRLITEVRGGDPGYGDTSKMLAESAMCLARDDLPARAGQITPAVAMGQALIDRLERAGIEFRVVEQ